MSSQTRVLVVDDEPAIRNSLVEFLKDCQFDVSAAGSAEGALDLIARIPIDVALVDIRLPRLDGESLILQAHLLRPHMRFLIHTGSMAYKLSDELKNARGDPGTCFFQAPDGPDGFQRGHRQPDGPGKPDQRYGPGQSVSNPSDDPGGQRPYPLEPAFGPVIGWFIHTLLHFQRAL